MKNVLLLTGGLYHPFEAAGQILKAAFENTGLYRVDHTENRETLVAGSIVMYDAIVSYVCAGELSPEQETGLVEYVGGGKPYIGLHGATTLRGEHPAYDDMLGGRFVSHPPICELAVSIIDRGHPVTMGMSDFVITDELYILDEFSATQSCVLATATVEGQTHPVAYTKRYGKGNVFYLALGHDERALNHPSFLQMLLNGLGWVLNPMR